MYVYVFVDVYIQVKDRFCSLLSDQVASLQDQLKQMRLDKTPEPDEPSAEDPSHPKHAQEVCDKQLRRANHTVHGKYVYSRLLHV